MQTRRNVLSFTAAFLLGGCSLRQQQLDLPVRLDPSLTGYVPAMRSPRLEVINLMGAIEHARALLAREQVDETEMVLALCPADGCSMMKLVRLSRKELDALDKKHPAHEQKEIRSISNDATIAWTGKLNGINTPFQVLYPADHAVLALKRTVKDMETKRARVVVYTPYTRHIDRPSMRIRGYEYLVSIMQKGYDWLGVRNVRSRAFHSNSIGSVVPLSTALCLAIIEHIDPSLMGAHTFEELADRVLVTVAANGSNAYTGASSSAHAYGLLQFIKSTYVMLVHDYPEAGLMPDFAEGMRNHTNAVAASLLLFDRDLSQLPYLRRLVVWWDPMMRDEYLAAMYNSGRAAKYMEKFGSNWAKKLPEETKKYLTELIKMRSHLITSDSEHEALAYEN